MANLPVRRSSGEPPVAQPPRGSWDPFQSLRELMRWDPFSEPGRSWLSPEVTQFLPAFEVKETPQAFVFKADVPGVKESDLEVTLQGNRLTVRGKREADKQEQHETYYSYERSYGTFLRTFTLPEGIHAESCTADLKDGVLTLCVPKRQEAQPRRIAVKSAGEKEEKAKA